MNTKDLNTRDLAPDFWRRKSLDQLTSAEWEALCDGCGKCCVLKLEDEDTGQVYYTDVACRLFDDATCRCGNYSMRKQLVRECVVLTPQTLATELSWMPQTCAYRLLAEGKPLYDWHPLVSGDANSVHLSGASVQGVTVPEYEVDPDDLEDHIVSDEISERL